MKNDPKEKNTELEVTSKTQINEKSVYSEFDYEQTNEDLNNYWDDEYDNNLGDLTLF